MENRYSIGLLDLVYVIDDKTGKLASLQYICHGCHKDKGSNLITALEHAHKCKGESLNEKMD
jgi:hypothetical protein